MGRKRLSIITKKCERAGCNNTFQVKEGAKYQRRYCSQRCAALASAGQRKQRRRRMKTKGFQITWERVAFTIADLQNAIVNLGEADGGKFADMCNAILRGEKVLLGV